jgi:hypothetical protein
MYRNNLYLYTHFSILFLLVGTIFVASNPCTGLLHALGFQEVEAPRYLDNERMIMARL